MNSQARKKGPLKGDHHVIAGVHKRGKGLDIPNSSNEQVGSVGDLAGSGSSSYASSLGGAQQKGAPPKDTKAQYSARKSPNSRKSPRSSPRTSPARRTPSPHHIHKTYKDGRISPRTTTRGLKVPKMPKLTHGAAPAHEAKGAVGGGSRSAFAEANRNPQAVNSALSPGSSKRGPSPPSTEVTQILASKSGTTGGKTINYENPVRDFEVNARQKPSALINAPKVNPNIDSISGSSLGGSRLIMSKVGRPSRKPGRSIDRNREFLNNPIPQGDSILPWFHSNATHGNAGTQTALFDGLKTSSQTEFSKDAGVNAVFETTRRWSNSWGPSARRAALATEKEKEDQKVSNEPAAADGNCTGTNPVVPKDYDGAVNGPRFLKEISISDIDKMQALLSQMKADMLENEQISDVVGSGPLREMLEQHKDHFDDVGTDLEVLSNSVQDEHASLLAKTRRRAKSGPAALRRNYGDLKEILEEMNEMKGQPDKSVRASFEELEEEIRRERLSGHGRTDGNAGPYAVYMRAQERLRSSCIGDNGSFAPNLKMFRSKSDDIDISDAEEGASRRDGVEKYIGNANCEKTDNADGGAAPNCLSGGRVRTGGSCNVIEFPSDVNWEDDTKWNEDSEILKIAKSPPKVSPLLPIETGIPRLKLEGLSLLVKSPRSQNSCNSPDLSKSLDITSPRSAFSKTSARSTLTNSSTGSN
eukprot:Stramenopile-MAST_4_protein_3634